jgi:hypothetical protein
MSLLTGHKWDVIKWLSSVYGEVRCKVIMAQYDLNNV